MKSIKIKYTPTLIPATTPIPLTSDVFKHQLHTAPDVSVKFLVNLVVRLRLRFNWLKSSLNSFSLQRTSVLSTNLKPTGNITFSCNWLYVYLCNGFVVLCTDPLGLSQRTFLNQIIVWWIYVSFLEESGSCVLFEKSVNQSWRIFSGTELIGFLPN